MAKSTPSVEWKKVKYLRQGETDQYDYELVLPTPLADWDVFDYWERERTIHLAQNLKRGDILFDIGAEHGWLSAVLAMTVGSDSLVLVEPTKEFWPNIKATFEKNDLGKPLFSIEALISDHEDKVLPEDIWGSIEGELIERNKYEYLHEHSRPILQTTVDTVAYKLGIVPDALNIDIEGAEFLALKGSEKTLKQYKPKVWCSIHYDLMERDYGHTLEQLIDYMVSLDYEPELLSLDHEAHWYFK